MKFSKRLAQADLNVFKNCRARLTLSKKKVENFMTYL